MNYKKIIVSEDNKLVLDDYNLSNENAEILDLNKSLEDVCTDVELQKFIKETAVDPAKIYLVCLKEDFGSYEQRVESISNVKKLYKILKKIFKEDNVFFFIYNTHNKNEVAINPTLNTPSKLTTKPSVSATSITADEYEERPGEISDSDLEEIDDFSTKPVKKDIPEIKATTIEKEKIEKENIDEEIAPSEEIISSDNLTNEFETIQSETELADNKQEEDYSSELPPPSEDLDLNSPILVPNAPAEEIIEQKELPKFIENEWNLLDTSDLDEKQIVSDRDITLAETEKSKNLNLLNEDKNEIVDVPESFYDADELDLNVENVDYDEFFDFKNDYELNVHALKSIYDFIWRMLILNNYNLKLNDLLYLSINNLSTFSIGQSDFIRQISNKADSLFDLIFQLDVKLEFNNSLFYIYLAQLFSIKANRIVINNYFLNTLSIWVNKSSKNKFIEQVEQFINYSTIYNKKIIFAHFIELANFIKGSLLSIKPSMNLVDIHRVMSNKFSKYRNENIFVFLVTKMNEIFSRANIKIESEIFESPDNMFDEKNNVVNDLTWKEKLIDLYKRFLSNTRSYVLSKGNNELEIFNLYIDIKDLKLYFEENAESLFLIQDDFPSKDRFNDKYITIGDAIDRSSSSVPAMTHEDLTELGEKEFMEKFNQMDKQGNLFYKDQNAQEADECNGCSTEEDEDIKEFLEIKNKYSDVEDEFNFKTLEEMSNSKESTASENAQTYDLNHFQNEGIMEKVVQSDNLSNDYKYKFVNNSLEDMMTKKIEEYERKIKENISRIEAERKQLRLKMEELKNL